MLDYIMRVDFSGGRWFQVKVVIDVTEKKLEIKMNPNTLVIALDEKQKVISALQTAVEAIQRHDSALPS